MGRKNLSCSLLRHWILIRSLFRDRNCWLQENKIWSLHIVCYFAWDQFSNQNTLSRIRSLIGNYTHWSKLSIMHKNSLLCTLKNITQNVILKLIPVVLNLFWHNSNICKTTICKIHWYESYGCWIACMYCTCA